MGYMRPMDIHGMHMGYMYIKGDHAIHSSHGAMVHLSHRYQWDACTTWVILNNMSRFVRSSPLVPSGSYYQPLVPKHISGMNLREVMPHLFAIVGSWKPFLETSPGRVR